MTKNDGGPAFPCELENTSEHDTTGYMDEALPKHTTAVYGGMSMRDYFAAHATETDIAEFLPVQYAQSQSRSGLASGYDSAFMQHQMQAKVTRQEARFRYADAMIEARGK